MIPKHVEIGYDLVDVFEFWEYKVACYYKEIFQGARLLSKIICS